MPRTEHLNNISPNRIYALDAQVLYKHETPRMTTAIIQQENVQSCIKIPNMMMMQENENDIMEGANYHFGFCYVSPNGWINVRHPNKSITQINQEEAPHVKIIDLNEIVSNSSQLNGHYLTTLLYVINVNPVKTVQKGDKELSLCILSCYASGYLVDVTLWNYDLPIVDMAGNWVVFSGFRLKKLIDWKFVFVSSVYSKIAKYDGQIKGIPYFPTAHYHNLSNIFQRHSVSQINYLINENDKIYSQTEGLLSKIQPFTYEGCSACKKKANLEVKCDCNPGNEMKIFTIIKVVIESDGHSLEASVFEEKIQDGLMSLKGPTRLRFNIKSSRRFISPESESVQISHIISKAEML